MTTTEKPRASFPWMATIVCFIAVIILCSLGVWQINRLAWKNTLQEQLDTAFGLPDNSLSSLNITAIKAGDIRRGFITGDADITKAIILKGRVYNGQAMQSLVMPLMVDNILIPVEMGCGKNIVANDFHGMDISRKQMTIKAVARAASWSYFTPPNIPAKGDWWRINHDDLGAYWGHDVAAGVLVTAEESLYDDKGLTPCPIEKTLRNNHQQYALFWFTMAGVLILLWWLRFLRPYLHSA